MYTLYGYPKTRSLRVAWALEELELEYDYQLVDLKKGAHLTADFATLTPTAKIPLLRTSAGLLSESAAIVTHLADIHGAGTLIPHPGTQERGHFEQMMFFLVAELEQPLWNLAKHSFALPAQYRIDAMKTTSRWEFTRALQAFCGLLGNNTFVAGNEFTVADTVAGHLLAWARSSHLDLTYDHVKSYADRVLSRPAYRRAWERENNQLAG